VALVALTCAAGLALYLNPLAFWLCVAAVPVIVCYPLAKRAFPVPQLVLAIAWGFAVLISWSAAGCGENATSSCLGPETWLLWGATVLWTLGFDTVYALADREDDRRIGVNSSAIFFGEAAPEAILAFYAGTALLLALLGVRLGLHLSFWATWAIATAGWARQYGQLRQPQLPPARYGSMFRENVAFGFALLAGFALGLFWE